MVLELLNTVWLHELDKRVECRSRNGEKELERERKQRILSAGEFGRKQCVEDVFILGENRVPKCFTIRSRVRSTFVHSYVEKIECYRPFDIFGVDSHKLAIKWLARG